jgi:hypothetical protein
LANWRICPSSMVRLLLWRMLWSSGPPLHDSFWHFLSSEVLSQPVLFRLYKFYYCFIAIIFTIILYHSCSSAPASYCIPFTWLIRNNPHESNTLLHLLE